MRGTTFYDFQVEPKPDSCWDLHTGPDGRIYVSACCERLRGGIVHILRYNEATDSLDHVLNVAEAVGEPATSGRATQCKIHYGFAASAQDGILYAATHLSAPGYGRKGYQHWGEWKTDSAFPCSYVVAYDTRRDAVAWTSPFIPREGCRCLAFDGQRQRLYAISYPRDHFWIFDIRTRTIRSLGRISSINSQALFTDRRGRVFTSNDQGQIVRYDPETDRLLELPVYVPFTPGMGGWHNVFYDVVGSPDGDCVYGVPWAADPHLFRYWPEDGPVGRIEDLGGAHQRRSPYVPMPFKFDHCGGLVFAADGNLYFCTTRWCEGTESDPERHRVEGVIVQFDPRTGRRSDFAKVTRTNGTAHYSSRAGRDGHGNLYFGMQGDPGPGMARLAMDATGESLQFPLRTWG